MYKKAQGISLTTVVIAAIALLVLVVLSVIFIGRSGFWTKQVSECENKGGKCTKFPNQECGSIGSGTEAKGDSDGYPTLYTGWTCSDNKNCCIKVTQ